MPTVIALAIRPVTRSPVVARPSGTGTGTVMADPAPKPVPCQLDASVAGNSASPRNGVGAGGSGSGSSRPLVARLPSDTPPIAGSGSVAAPVT
ncbi:MAG: hypothetical protein AB7P21_21415 [Lautropia sp.]